MDQAQGRHLARAATIAGTLILLSVAAACGGASATGTTVPTPPALEHGEAPSAAEWTLVASAEELQVVLDTSASVPMTYKPQTLSAIADVVSAWPRPLSAAGESPPQPGLIIQVRGVSAYSYAPESVLGTWSVRGIPGVRALPSAVTPDFTQRVITYKNERGAAEAAYKKSVSDARRGAAGLRRLRPKTTFVSEIEGAVSAAAQSFSPAGVRKLVMISDLAQNRKRQIAGSLQGVDVLIAHICRSASTCRSQERVWGDRLRRRGATSVTFVRIERLASAIATFLREA